MWQSMEARREASPLKRARATTPTRNEVTFGRDELIVSKTDLKGKITYVNSVCCRICGYRPEQMIGQPHAMLRHPDMPRAIFKLLWDQITARQEVFAYVKNMTKNGDFYWVFAHVTPSINGVGEVVGYHSNRRVPRRDLISAVIEPLYAQLLAEERAEANARAGLARSSALLDTTVRAKARSYDEFIFSL